MEMVQWVKYKAFSRVFEEINIYLLKTDKSSSEPNPPPKPSFESSWTRRTTPWSLWLNPLLPNWGGGNPPRPTTAAPAAPTIIQNRMNLHQVLAISMFCIWKRNYDSPINTINKWSWTGWILRGHRGRDCMVVGFTATYVISVYNQWCCDFESRPGRGVQHYEIKFVSDLRQVGGFLRALRFPSPIKLTTIIYLKYCWKWR